MLVRVAALLTTLGVLIIPLCFGCGALGLEDTEPHTENYTVSENAQVTLLNGDLSGDIGVETWGKDYVEVTWTKSTSWGEDELSKADVEVTESPGGLEIKTKLQDKNAKLSVNYDIKLPRTALLAKVTAGDGNINITGTSGDTVIVAKFGSISAKNTAGYMDITAEKGKIRLEGTTGGAKLTTTESPIEVVDADGDIEATNSNGGITISDCKGDMTLETYKGSINVSNLQGCVSLAKTNNAPINITGATTVGVVETSSADVVAEISSIGASGTTITVNAGSISLRLSNDINADIELKTLSGDIITHSFGGITTSGDTAEGYLKGTVGSGGNKIYVETTKGNIDLFRLETTP